MREGQDVSGCDQGLVSAPDAPEDAVLVDGEVTNQIGTEGDAVSDSDLDEFEGPPLYELAAEAVAAGPEECQKLLAGESFEWLRRVKDKQLGKYLKNYPVKAKVTYRALRVGARQAGHA